jgi:rhamnose utilization protein RhaD (predicted bifunctional aldolase and dehydrogenase)
MIKPEVAIVALKKHGIIVSEDQAKEIIETMFLVNLSVDKSLHPSSWWSFRVTKKAILRQP